MNERTEAIGSFGGGTRRAAVSRAALTALVVPLGLLLAIAAAGAGSPAGFALAVAPLYLLWVWLVDVVALVRGLRGRVAFAPRPRFVLWVTACVVPVFAYLIWAAFHLQVG